MKPILTAVIIAKNEAERISICLNALTFCDEILVIDNASGDRTADIAAKYGANVETMHTEDFSALRNRALEKARGRWILYVDADEVVAETLARSIRAVVTSSTAKDGKPYSAYLLKRINYYLGKQWPGHEWMLRLFHREYLKGWTGELHESPNVRGLCGKLEGELRHDTHRSLSGMVRKTNTWSETEADLRIVSNHPPVTWWRLLRVFFTGFFRSYIRQGGWRVGTVGLIESMYQGFSMFITYAKLWERQKAS